MGLLSDEKRPPCSPLQRPTGTFVTNPHPQGRLGTLEPAAGGCRGTRPGWTRCARLAAWRRRELGPTPGAPGQRNEAPEGRGRPSARPGPAAPGGSFPAPPSSAPSCMDSCRSCSAPDATPTPRALAFPPLGPSPFPRIRIGVGSAPGARQGRRASFGLSPLSLHPLCPSGLADRARCNVPCGVCAADGPLPAHFWTWLSPVLVPCAPSRPSAPPSTSPRPFPSLTPQPPGLRAPCALGISCPCSFVRGGPGSVTCAALYGAVCKNKPVGILVVSVPSRSRRPGPAPTARACPGGGRRGGLGSPGGQLSPVGPAPL